VPKYVLDEETGEILEVLEGDKKFEIKGQSEVEWVLSQMLDIDVERAGIEARKKAYIENLDAQINRCKQDKARLEFLFGPDIFQYASKNLPKGKATWTCDFGKVKSTTTKEPSLKTKDEKWALEWAKEKCKEAIKQVEEFKISLVPDDVKKNLIADPEVAAKYGFTVEQPGTTWKIDTGVK